MGPNTKQNNYKTEPIILALFGTNLNLPTYLGFFHSHHVSDPTPPKAVKLLDNGILLI